MYKLREHPRKWLILAEKKYPRVGFTDRQLLYALDEMGIAGCLVDESEYSALPKIILENDFELVYWECLTGWNAYHIISQLNCRKVNAWYDDPVMRMDYANKRQLFESSHKKGVEFYVWDSYWVEELYRHYDINAKPIHLGALTGEYYESTLAIQNNPVFIGSLHSPKWIKQLKDRVRDPFKTIITTFENDIKNLPTVPSWNVIESHYLHAMKDGDRRIFQDISFLDPEILFAFRQAIWAVSKNEVRIRMLKAALEVSPVFMFSETKSWHHMKEEEFRRILGHQEDKLEFHDTSDMKVDRMGVLYHYGWVHLQATDPQSMREGYPYRMFQTLASGKVLLSDMKDNWQKDFNFASELVGYESMPEFKEKLNNLLKNKNLCRSIGENARKGFIDRHQWKHRIESILNETNAKQCVS
jgi:hypothetical protein